MHPTSETEITGRCYCGAITFRSAVAPQTVAYCHCSDCRRATGGPVAAFAAFLEGDVVFEPSEGKQVTVNPGVARTFCAHCGSSLTGRYDYIPNQVYISIGVIDQADVLPPEMHSHDDQRLDWLHIDDDIARFQVTARDALNTAGDS